VFLVPRRNDPAVATVRAAHQPAALVYGLLLFAVVAWGGSFVAARLVLSPPDGGAAVTPTGLAVTGAADDSNATARAAQR
jgi:hypothetical protein